MKKYLTKIQAEFIIQMFGLKSYDLNLLTEKADTENGTFPNFLTSDIVDLLKSKNIDLKEDFLDNQLKLCDELTRFKR